YVLQFADTKILDYQEELEVNKKFRNMGYQEWKGRMLAKFDKGLTKKEYLRCCQRKDELCFEYFTRMAYEGRKIIEDEELIFEISLLGIKRYKEEIELLAMHFQEISEEFLEKVRKLEEIKKDAWKRRQDSKLASNQNKFKERSPLPQKMVNNVEDIKDIIKENYVYLYN
ncbi:hypothetical protein NGRA_3633, partial [Nosema granulosis]